MSLNNAVTAPVQLKDLARLDQMTEFHNVSAGISLVILIFSLPQRLEHGAPVACADPARP